ncbi:MAG: hypothetical protein AAGC85_25130 [Bacteroidota bacterium]
MCRCKPTDLWALIEEEERSIMHIIVAISFTEAEFIFGRKEKLIELIG